jgi:hypothetical protein
VRRGISDENLRRWTDLLDVTFVSRDAPSFAPTREMKMRNAFVIAGFFALTTALNSTAALAQSSGGGMSAMGSASGSASAQADADLRGTRSLGKANVDGKRSLARANIAAGSHGLKGRNIARTRGANKTGFCPPGQAKKPGSGSRFEC